MELIIGHRPGKKTKDTLQSQAITHMLTLLCEKERPASCKAIADEIGAVWLNFPMEGARLETLVETDITTLFALHDELASQTAPVKLFLHCSAGIHRTGFVAYLFLRRSGLTPQAARKALKTLRPVTGQDVGSERIALAEEMFLAFDS